MEPDSPKAYVGGRAMCVACAQQGQFPALAFWAKLILYASCPFATDPSRRKKCAGMRLKCLAPPLTAYSLSSKGRITRRRAWMAEIQTDRAREGGQGLLSRRTCEGRGACVRVEPGGWLPRSMHLDQDEFPIGDWHSDVFEPGVPVIPFPGNANSPE